MQGVRFSFWTKLAIVCFLHYQESVAAIKLFRKNKNRNGKASKKGVRDRHFTDEGLMDDHRDDFAAFLLQRVSRRFQRFTFRLFCLCFTWWTAYANPSESKSKVSSDWDVVENFFGRINTLWSELSQKYR